MRLKIIRAIIRFLLWLLTHTELRGEANVLREGNFIIAANHLGLVDSVIPFYFLNNSNLVLLVGEKWGKIPFLRWLGRQLNFIFIDRFNPDLKALRLVIEKMRSGHVLVITPEGTRSKTGLLLEGRPGVSYLAAKLRVPILPAGISGTFDRTFFGQLKRLKRPHIVINVGPSFTLPKLPSESASRDEALKEDTEEIMCRIASLLPPEQRGFYAGHPRVEELGSPTSS
jgi:1-acyl-sn-glycerol-3-phosphate acyltransferase